MKTITHADLVFKPLEGSTSFIDNAVIQVKPHFRLSISKNRSQGMWYVGRDDEYEVAIQAFAVPGGLGDLVWYKNDTVIRDCDLETINELAKYAEGLTYIGKIEVFDVGDRKVCPDGMPRWLERFHCAEGIDAEKKIQYANRVWRRGRFRFIPVKESNGQSKP